MNRRTDKMLSSIILLAVLAAAVYWLWWEHEGDLAGFDIAGVKPVPGAEVIDVRHIDETMMGGTTVWMYRLPHDYSQNLYKACSGIGYKNGTYRDGGGSTPDMDTYVKPGEVGCYTEKYTKTDTITAQFVNDKLIVEDIY